MGISKLDIETVDIFCEILVSDTLLLCVVLIIYYIYIYIYIVYFLYISCN